MWIGLTCLSFLALLPTLVVTDAYLASDDILLSEGQALRNDPNTAWPTDRSIAYFFDGIAIDKQEKIRKGFEFWEKHTCLRFQENGWNTPRIRVYKGGDCSSEIGRNPNSTTQRLSLDNDCERFGIATHEIAHTLGIHHQQNRYDRDQYVTINWFNINQYKDKAELNFKALSYQETDNYGVPYDYGSVLHYGALDFCKNLDINVITARDPLYQSTMGQRIQPSFYDILLVNKRYNCLPRCPNFYCANNGYRNPANCNECVCPWGFGGQLCDKRDPGRNNSATCGEDIEAGPHFATLRATLGPSMLSKPKASIHDHCHWHIKADL
ncbi:hypothetical protein L596_022753 [Steinernema carpocapsae]|uniref:Zinc metalloproteinase n=1 Tax=Steinernema carpocapsae TaxID=34508 RepID=A0A4U5MMR1_STECR|nr:hypothetical protein L596_022753 [Steinernema carpocapsae]